MIGRTIAHYEILEEIGAGGMGVVYRARDTHLDREVAIKVLPDEFAADPERLARFEREAKLLATLNHPNIGAIYGLEKEEDRLFLILELVEGEALADRISRGPIPLKGSLSLALQIAGAVESAHERGIIHRDLKPGNVMIDKEGNAKILDFGLAKALQTADASTAPDLSQSPTLTAEMTAPGVLVGTAAYMSPEQVRGQPADRRSDIWALGCILLEMLSGRRAFPGDTVPESLARILEREPDWTALPQGTPRDIRTLLRRCLARDPGRRLQHMGDVRLELEEMPDEESEEPAVLEPVALWRRVSPWAVAAVMAGLAVWSLLWASRYDAPQPVHRLAIRTARLAVGPHPVSPILALSSDGSLLAYISGEGDSGQIVVRRLNSFEERRLEGTDNAQAPFFSPDGSWIGFAAGGELKKVPVEGGKTRTICNVIDMHGGSWGRDGTIVFSKSAEGLYRVAADGGEPEPLTEVDLDRGEFYHSYPQLLPGGREVLFTTLDGGGRALEIAMLSLASGERRTVLAGGSNARWLPSGHLVYAMDGSLYTAPFGPDNADVAGTPVSVVDGLMMGFPLEPSFAHFTVADNGTLAYVAGPAEAGGSRLVRVDRAGSAEPLGEVQQRLFSPEFSPDGRWLAVAAEVKGLPMHIWLHDLERDTFSRLTFEGQNWHPLWTPDGRRIVFNKVLQGRLANLFWMPADGSASAEQLAASDSAQLANSWTPDGKTLIFTQIDFPEQDWNLMALEVGGGAEPRPLLSSPFHELQGSVSPDGHWLAYVSDESGQYEVYVRSYPELDRKWQISNQGGVEPAWSPRGDELFYREDLEGRKMMAVEIAPGTELRPGRARLLFEGDYAPTPLYDRNFGVAPDGRGFVLIDQVFAAPVAAELRVVLHWFEELKQAVAAGQG